MAHTLCCKYGYHLPLYRQSQMFENQGNDLSGSLLCSWVGKITKLLERLSDASRDHVFKGQAIFMDDTTVKLLQKGKGHGKNKIKRRGFGITLHTRDLGVVHHPLRFGISSPKCEGLNTPANIWKPINALPRRMLMRGIMMPIARGASKR